MKNRNNTMKTLQEIKNHYAQEQGYEDWRELQEFHSRNPREIESLIQKMKKCQENTPR